MIRQVESQENNKPNIMSQATRRNVIIIVVIILREKYIILSISFSVQK